ncbi:site-specific integrase [Vibrio superstes]|uniref:Tyr recombinase domain-containing protein n=1 Tax=Vibrio superstes NBRC 103154 TaxID=1219062 RepID=A0A511QTZ3_9VIBR|nr:site-specific integrase [Vibrio superstes]GEM80824.1 hypothetical protein VSU01S_30690 [Vibrio superstes NBRC 103154]
MTSNNLTAADIQGYLHEMGLSPLAKEHYDAVIMLIAEDSQNRRVLTDESLERIRSHIKTIPSGRQRKLKGALDHTLLYLQNACQWQLPEQKSRVYRDHMESWLVQIMKHAHLGGALYGEYKKQDWVSKGKTLSPYEIITLLSMEVAPLSMAHWIDILKRPDSIDVFEDRLTLKVHHPLKHTKQLPSFTRYSLTPTACYALHHYYKQTSKGKRCIREARLLESINDEANKLHVVHPLLARLYPKPITAREWHLAIQSVWHCQYGYPPELLSDLVQPTRHFAFKPVVVSDTHTRKGLRKCFELPQIERQPKAQTSVKTYWPHLALLKRLASEPRTVLKTALSNEEDLEWPIDNVLPPLLHLFIKDLIVHGGIKVKMLSDASLVKYTGIYTKLPSPLSYLDASDPVKLDAWAKQAFETQESEAHQWLVYNFLRFLSHLALTDHLDIHQFECPTLPMNVDAYRLSTEQVHYAVHTLVNTNKGTSLQRLFSAVALLLGYYGALRRGEIVRLRIQDVVVISTRKHQFRLHITETVEGKTKNGQSRYVHVVMPSASANLLVALLKIKQTCPKDAPLLGFIGESSSSRQLHYLYPVTQVLKALYGNQVRFHHLRHSGAHLLYLQGLSLACEFHDHSTPDLYTELMLTKEVCEARFEFWLQNNDFSQMNDGILLDVIGEQLGHSHYATTRLSYLHGIEWLPEFFTPKREYSIKQLRTLIGKHRTHFLLSLPSIAKRLPANTKLNATTTITLSDAELTDEFLLTSIGNALPRHYVPSLPLIDTFDDNRLFDIWLNTLHYNHVKTHKPSARSKAVPTFNWQTPMLIDTLMNKGVSFEAVSDFWYMTGKHRDFGLSKRQRNALQCLGPIDVLDERSFSVSFACNHFNAEAFEALFRSRLFQCFEVSFLLEQNRKQSPTRKLELIKTYYAKKGEHITVNTIATGASRFTAVFRFIPDSPLLFHTLIDYLK